MNVPAPKSLQNGLQPQTPSSPVNAVPVSGDVLLIT